MAFIKVQKLVRDEDGNITSGSAAIVETQYGNFGTYHAKHSVRERLGKVLYLSEDKKSGIFQSPTRGITEYNAVTDTFAEVERDDPRLAGTSLFPDPEIHTIFGDVYLLLRFLENNQILNVLRDTFPRKEQYERHICHVLHTIIKDGSRISCENFYIRSFLSHLCIDVSAGTLKSDTYYFSYMGSDDMKMKFFKNFTSYMKKRYPNFASACYVDSTPLPNDIVNNPFNALCSHGVSCTEVMCRLVLILDEETGIPVWYDIIPGNVLDINTLKTVEADVQSNLGIFLNSYTLDAGYISKELITEICKDNTKLFLGRMPARKGFPYKECYNAVKGMFSKGKYAFVRAGHTYFGKKLEKVVFGVKVFIYVYVDEYNASKRFRDYLIDHEAEFEKMKDKDKDWEKVKGGFFTLISNKDDTPKNILIDYYGRTQIESVFKTSKEYLDLLPLCKWTDLTVRGKLLNDIICTIILLEYRKFVKATDKGKSVSDIFGTASAQMCAMAGPNNVVIETANKQTKEIYKMFDIKQIPSLNLEEFTKDMLL